MRRRKGVPVAGTVLLLIGTALVIYAVGVVAVVSMLSSVRR